MKTYTVVLRANGIDEMQVEVEDDEDESTAEDKALQEYAGDGEVEWAVESVHAD